MLTITDVGSGLTIGTPDQPSKPAISRVTPTTIHLKWVVPTVIGQLPGQNRDEDPISFTLEHDDGSKG